MGVKDGGRKQKINLHGLSFWRRHCLNCKDPRPVKKEEARR
jgi:hypothetical protein